MLLCSYPRETNFMDLPPELRQSIEALEKTIQAHADAARPFSARVDPTSQLDQIENKLNLLEEKIAVYSSHHAQQSSRIASTKKMTSAHWRYAESVARTIDASRHNNPQEPGKVHWSRAFAPNDPTASHFDDILNEMDQQLQQAEQVYDSIRRQIEPLTTGIEGAHSPAESVKIIIKHEQSITAALNRRYAQLKEEIDAMRKVYRAFCVKYRNDSRDPFASRVEKPAEPKIASPASQLPTQPTPAASRPVAGLATTGFAPVFTQPTVSSTPQQPTSLSSLLPSATTSLAPVRPASSSLFSGFSLGK